jgi:hypothetical protein
VQQEGGTLCTSICTQTTPNCPPKRNIWQRGPIRTGGAALPCVRTDSKMPAVSGVKKLLDTELARQNAQPRAVTTFKLRKPSLAGTKGLAVAPVGVDQVHVAVGELPRNGAAFRRLYVVVARQQGNQMVLRHLFSR